MSATNAYAEVGVARRNSRTNDRGENTALGEECIETTRRFANALLVEGEPLGIDEFVARVLGRAHQAAYAHAAPDEARVILDLAHLFADELAKADLRFDRLRLIHAATAEPA
jgi:hypothetical protein